jgi:GT2 family glycosyltransferase
MLDIVACIVTYRSAVEEVAAAVRSFYDTTLNVHLMIVDNDSGEEYISALKAAVDPRAEIIPSGRNGGFGFGNNISIMRAPACRYFLCLNPDVVIHHGTLEALADYMDNHQDVGVCTPKTLYEDGRLQPLNKRQPTVFDLFARRFLPAYIQRIPFVQQRMDAYMMLDVGYEHEVDVPFMTGCFMFFRKEILDRVGGFDERYFMYLEDADITIRTRAISRAVYVPHATIMHRWKRGSHTSKKLFMVMLHSMWIYFNTYGWKAW